MSSIKHKAMQIVIPLTVLAVFAVLFVGWDVIERRIVPDMSTGMRHFLLTVRAAIVTIVASALVYLLMRRQQKQLSRTAEQLTDLLASYNSDSAAALRFDNPHLVHCREVLNCRRMECPMYHAPNKRCWQEMGLNGSSRDPLARRIELQQCHECKVYRLACPDKLTELGESFNNLMYLLESEKARVGRMRRQMSEKHKMVAIGQIAAGIAHEVGNPLSSISSIAQMLKRHHAEAPFASELDLIQTHIQRISAIVRQLVGLARPGPEYWERCDLARTLEDAVQLISFDRRSKKVKIDFRQPTGLPETYCLRGQLQQVFINLALNALDAMPDGGALRIRAKAEHGNIVVMIEDTGCGIALEIQDQIFEPFFTTKAAGEGTGLGLAVSHSIIQKHGGTMECRSVMGEGATFTVQIPILDRAPDA